MLDEEEGVRAEDCDWKGRDGVEDKVGMMNEDEMKRLIGEIQFRLIAWRQRAKVSWGKGV